MPPLRSLPIVSVGGEDGGEVKPRSKLFDEGIVRIEPSSDLGLASCCGLGVLLGGDPIGLGLSGRLKCANAADQPGGLDRLAGQDESPVQVERPLFA
jgi:hypothetical protein